MEMEGGDISNKRKKICHDDDDHINIAFEDDDDDEEKKIQKFFSIIRSIREARDHILTNGSEEENKRKKMKKKVDEEEKAVAVAVWNPSFRPEDFAADDDKLIKYAPMAINFVDSSAKNAETAGKEEDIVVKEGLDLKLSL
ncbi:hypothetical protein ACSBR2_021427 [Camellia fascicularis]